jgi:biotin carboxyl carrier protein
MSTQTAQTPDLKPARSSSEASLPDGPRVQHQLASLVENAKGEMRPLMEFLRALLNARALALFPASAGVSSVVVTTRGILATSLEPLGERLASATSAVVEPAEALGKDAYTLAVPVRRDDHPLWVLIAQLFVPNARDLQAYLVILQSVAGYLLYREQRLVTEDTHWVLTRTSGLLDVFRRAGSEEDHEKACRIAVDALRDFMGCSSVVYGRKSHGGIRLRTISGVQKIDSKSPSHQPIETALHEAVLLEQKIEYPENKSAVAHELLQKQIKTTRLVSQPFHEGVIHFQWEGEPDPRTPALVNAALPFIPPLFELIERAKPNPVVYFTRRFWKKLSTNRRRAIITGCLLLAGLLAFPFHYSVRCDCRLVPRTKRIIAAPFDGQLGRTNVQPGDSVKDDQALVALDNRELKLKEAELIAARDQALKKRDRAMSAPDGADFSAAQVAAFEAQSVSEELSLVQRKLSVLEIKAPLAGVIVSGDLRRSEGQPVRQGQVLFEIAPLEEMLVEIDVSDREYNRVRKDMPVAFRLEAFGGWEGDSRIERIYPQSEQRNTANVFVVEAPVLKGAPELRPGMRGRAVIESDRRPLIWILGHRLIEWVQTTLWW